MAAAVQSDEQHEGSTDGRSARSLRTRAAVVEALLDLIREGLLRPTAREIADRAGISLRSVYVHFDDLEDLFVAAAREHHKAILERWQPVDATLAYPRRRDRYVDQRVDLLEFMTPVARAAALHENESPAIARVLQKGARQTALEIGTVFASELAAIDHDRRVGVIDAITTLIGAESWHALRARRGLGTTEAADVLRTAIDALLGAR